jgi:hypothetical protein
MRFEMEEISPAFGLRNDGHDARDVIPKNMTSKPA